ncbi:hypothetical protein BDW62DRAFT_200802 [Aspergillus aurantiobrunneus]
MDFDRDVEYNHDPAPFPSYIQETMRGFLAQFYEFDRRWTGNFERCTECMLSSAAELQIDLFCDAGLGPAASPTTFSNENTENTLIALALHCLLIVRDIQMAEDMVVPMTEVELFDEGGTSIIITIMLQIGSIRG